MCNQGECLGYGEGCGVQIEHRWEVNEEKASEGRWARPQHWTRLWSHRAEVVDDGPKWAWGHVPPLGRTIWQKHRSREAVPDRPGL